MFVNINVFYVFLPYTSFNLPSIDSLLETYQLHLRLSQEDINSVLLHKMIPLKLTALMSRLFQRDLLSHLQKCDPLCVTIYREKGKKPFINSYEHIDWNVSHDGSAIFLSYIVECQPCRVGIDIMELKLQKRHKSVTDLIQRLHHQITEHELNWIFSTNNLIEVCMNGKNVKYFYSTQEQWLLKFFMIWTAKEAFLKADGSGISYNLNILNVELWKESYYKRTLNLVKSNQTKTPFILTLLPCMRIKKNEQQPSCQLIHWLHQETYDSIPVVCCVCLMNTPKNSIVNVNCSNVMFNSLLESNQWFHMLKSTK